MTKRHATDRSAPAAPIRTPPARNGEYAALPIVGIDDPDIGMCDFCGAEEGARYRTLVPAVIEGEACRCLTWMCGPCKRERAS